MVVSGQCFADCSHGFTGQGFEIARREIFFAELDVIHASACGFTYFFQEQAAPRGFVCGESAAIGNVIQTQRAFTTKVTKVHPGKSWIRFCDFGQDLGLFLLRATQVVFRQSIFQKFEGLFRRVQELELV